MHLFLTDSISLHKEEQENHSSVFNKARHLNRDHFSAMRDIGTLNVGISGKSAQLIAPSTLPCLKSKAKSFHTETCRSSDLKLQKNITAMN